MAKKFLTPIDLNKNELQNPVLQRLASAPSSPEEGQFYYNTTDDTPYVWANGAWLDLGVQGGTGATNLAATLSATNTIITSDTGTDATIPAVDGTNAGVMTPTMKTKLDGVEAGADVTDATNVDAAGAVMNSDTSTASMSFVVDEDDMISDSATKVPTQQSVRAYVLARVAALVDSSPAALDTLNELAAALGDDPNFAATTASSIGALDTRLDAVEANGGPTKKYSANIGDGAATSIVVTHNLGSKDVLSQVRQNSDDAVVECDITNNSTSQTTFSGFTVAPATNALRVVIVG